MFTHLLHQAARRQLHRRARRHPRPDAHQRRLTCSHQARTASLPVQRQRHAGYVQDTNGNRITAGYNAAGPARLPDRFQRRVPRPGLQRPGPSGQSDRLQRPDRDLRLRSTGQFLTSYTDVYGTTNYTYVTGQSAPEDNALAEIAYANGSDTLSSPTIPHGRLIDQHANGGAEDVNVHLPQPRRLHHHRRRRQHDHSLLQHLRRHRRDHRPAGQRHPLHLRHQSEPDQVVARTGRPTPTPTMPTAT